jgi:ubiquinone/menaquinone biosynthesis C-methylase UbiE
MKSESRKIDMRNLLHAATMVVIVFITWRIASRRRSLPCPVWLRWMVELDNPFTKTNRAAEIISHLGLEPGMTVLDAGCGPGRLTIPLARAVGAQGRVVAVDLQVGMLDRARNKAQAAPLENIEFVQAGLGDGKLGQERFDRALLVTVLGEILDREVALKEIHDALKPGGLLSVTEVIFDPHFQRQSTVTHLAGAVGFRETSTHGNCIAYTMILKKPKIDR